MQCSPDDCLLSIGVNVNYSLPNDGHSPLHEAIRLRYLDVVHKLLSAKTLKVMGEKLKEI
jgi:ankyrin repeat protein